MDEYLDIFTDVIRLATMQPRYRERVPSARGLDEPRRERIARTPRQFRTRGF